MLLETTGTKESLSVNLQIEVHLIAIVELAYGLSVTLVPIDLSIQFIIDVG